MASRLGAPASAPDARPEKCRVLVVDDSAVARLVVQRIINETGQFTVAGQAASAQEAFDRLDAIDVGLIILDIEMPGMDGIEAIPHLLRRSSNAPILVVSSHCREDAEASVRAMAMGASDVILKPESRALTERFAKSLKNKMIRLTDPEMAEKEASVDIAEPEPLRTAPKAEEGHPVKCLAIGASTGGIHALSTFFSALPCDLAMPILVTQHLPSDFIVYFARQLQLITGREAMPARDGQRVSDGEVLIAPGDAHLTVQEAERHVRIVFSDEKTPGGFCPSVDPMLSSVARVYGPDAVGVVLTGMGRDGADGARELADAGGELLVQDRESSVIWGMPGAVASQNIANLIAPPAELAGHIADRARKFGWK
jgi:two-component system chemotaxis response regulator CheB